MSQPVYVEPGQRFSWPRRQNWHDPSTPASQAAPTRSPTLNRVGPGPVAVTRPTISWPGVVRGWCGGRSPSARCRSVRQTPPGSSLIWSWPGPGSGTGRSPVSSSGPESIGPGLATTHARMGLTLRPPPLTGAAAGGTLVSSNRSHWWAGGHGLTALMLRKATMDQQERRQFVRDHRTCIFGYNRKNDGPAMTVVYYIMDGDDLLVSTMADRAKAKAVQPHHHVSLCVLDEPWPVTYLQVSGTAALDPDPEHAS